MSDECEVRMNEGETWCQHYPALIKNRQGGARFNIPILWMNCYQQCIFSSHLMHCRGIWDLNPGIFGTETSDYGSARPSFQIPVPGRNKKFLLCWGSNLTAVCKACFSLCATAANAFQMYVLSFWRPFTVFCR